MTPWISSGTPGTGAVLVNLDQLQYLDDHDRSERKVRLVFSGETRTITFGAREDRDAFVASIKEALGLS